jgi:hypothetical protein
LRVSEATAPVYPVAGEELDKIINKAFKLDPGLFGQ